MKLNVVPEMYQVKKLATVCNAYFTQKLAWNTVYVYVQVVWL